MAEDSVKCSKAGCEKRFNPETGDYQLCSLCRTQAYCCEGCRVEDWTFHGRECPNTTTLTNTELGWAVDYYYEDCMTPQQLAAQGVDSPVFQATGVRYDLGQGRVKEHFIPPLIEYCAESKEDTARLARGSPPQGDMVSEQGFTLRTTNVKTGEYWDVPLTTPHDMIYQGNEANPTANALAGGGKGFGRVKALFQGGLRRQMTLEDDKYVLWPKPTAVMGRNIVISDARPELVITLWHAGKEVSYVGTTFRMAPPRAGELGEAWRRLREQMQQQLKMKFGDAATRTMSIKNMVVKRYADMAGNGVIMTFSVPPRGETKLIDIEYQVDKQLVHRAIQQGREQGAVDDIVAALKKTESGRPTMPGREGDMSTAPAEAANAISQDSVMCATKTCNPRVYEEVGALMMALDDQLGLMGDNLVDEKKHLEDHLCTLRAYHTHLERNNLAAPTILPNDVVHAVDAALRALDTERLGAKAEREWKAKADCDPVVFQMAVKAVADDLRATREASLGLLGRTDPAATSKKKMLLVQTQMYERDLETAERAMNAKLREMRTSTGPPKEAFLRIQQNWPRAAPNESTPNAQELLGNISGLDMSAARTGAGGR